MLSDNRDFILTFIQIRNSLRKHTYIYIHFLEFLNYAQIYIYLEREREKSKTENTIA